MAAEETILSWNAANWITVLIMVVLGFAVLGMISQIVKQRRAAAAS
jgi:hypothetical protein